MIYGYLRVSSDEQDVNSQKQGVEAFAAAKGWTIEKYISDEGVSGGKNPDKRKLGPMLKQLRKGDIVICSEISRLGRDLYMVMDILHFCMTREVVVHTVKDGFTLGDSIQSKVLAFAFGLSAEIERQMIRQRTKEGLALRRKMGVLLGRGFVDGPARKAEVHSRMIKYKELILENYREGTSFRKMKQLFKADRQTILKYIVEWGEYRGKVEDMKEKLEKRREKDRARNRKEYAISNKKDNPRIFEISKERLKELILEYKTIPVIAQEFPDYTYDEVYERISQDKELHILYRARGHKLAKRDYEKEKKQYAEIG